jgi:hypothetical protein
MGISLLDQSLDPSGSSDAWQQRRIVIQNGMETLFVD